MSKIYFAGPLFSVSELEFNYTICRVFEDAGYDVFLPQRDGIVAADSECKDEDELVKAVFEKDTAKIAECDILVFVTDGRIPDEGACVELGIAYASGKRCYGIRTDVRAFEKSLSLNPLLAGCFKKIFTASTVDSLVLLIKNYLSENLL